MRISDWSSDVCSSDLNRHYVELAQQEGGRLVTGGEALRLAAPGYYMSPALIADTDPAMRRSEEHTSELQSLMRISYAASCLKKKKASIRTRVTVRQTKATTSARPRI